MKLKKINYPEFSDELKLGDTIKKVHYLSIGVRARYAKNHWEKCFVIQVDRTEAMAFDFTPEGYKQAQKAFESHLREMLQVLVDTYIESI